jgi:hypothetical protein
MDPSLAKGLKNQLFREISDDIDNSIKQWEKYCKESQLNKSRLKWEKFCEGIDGVYGPFLLAKHRGGSKRKPFICIATFENRTRQYNSWNERCIFSVLIYFANNPVWIETLSRGFSVSEHAIQRIFERSFTDDSPAENDFKKVHFASELQYVPLWSTFWVGVTNTVFKTESFDSIEIVLPSPNGLFFGEIRRDSYCEIRTFLSSSQLSSRQIILHGKMQVISHKFADSVIPFMFHKFISEQKGSVEQLTDFLIATEEITDMLRNEFQIKI